MEQELTQLEKKMEKLLEWKRNFDRERLKFPLDIQSRKEVQREVAVFKRAVSVGITDLATDFICFGLEILINDKKRVVFASFPLYPFSVSDYGTNTFSYSSSNIIDNGDSVLLTTSGTLPTGLDILTEYFVISATASTFQLSLTLGGSAVDVDLVPPPTGTSYFAKIS